MKNIFKNIFYSLVGVSMLAACEKEDYPMDLPQTPEEPTVPLPELSQTPAGMANAIFGNAEYDTNWRTQLKESGLNTLILFTIHINDDGSMNFNDMKVMDANGYYIGDPEWSNKVKDHLKGRTTINRIEICIGAWGSPSYNNIEKLIERDGTGEETILYKNWKKLMELTGATAICHDDEGHYEVEPTSKFVLMTAEIGYKHTLCPYNSGTFWQELFEKVEAEKPGTIDRVYLQCYAGGDGNDNSIESWNAKFPGVKVVPGYDCEADSPEEMATKFAKYLPNISGGFIWEYKKITDSNVSFSIGEYGKAINESLVTPETPEEGEETTEE